MTRRGTDPYARLSPHIPVVAVDLAVFTVRKGELYVLCIKMRKPPYTGLWALPGGLVRPGESVDAAAKAELKEKTGVSGAYLEQLYTFGDVKRDATRRAVSVAYVALVDAEGVALHTTDKYDGVDWIPARKLARLAYDHAEILRYAVTRLRWKLEYSNVAWSLLPQEFTLADLQDVYEAILGRALDKRNFRKKVLALGLVRATGKYERGAAHRPAELYRFARREPFEVHVL